MKYQGVTKERPTGSGLDRMLAITIFADAHARTKTDTIKTLRDLARLIPKRTAARKSGLRLLKAATFGDVKTIHGSLRHSANVLAINGVEGDYDGRCMPMTDAADRLRSAALRPSYIRHRLIGRTRPAGE